MKNETKPELVKPKRIRVWHIEDDPLQQESFHRNTEELLERKLDWHSFDSMTDACQCNDPAPDYLIFDVGSIGLMQADQTYLSAFHQLRDHFPHTPMLLVSFMSHLPTMIQKEFPDDDLLYPLIDHNLYHAVAEKLAQLEGLPL